MPWKRPVSGVYPRPSTSASLGSTVALAIARTIAPMATRAGEPGTPTLSRLFL